ncbi:hypothetical protein [Roseibium sp. M-1]
MTSHVSLQRDAYPVPFAAELYEEIRTELQRPDLSDADLEKALCGHELAVFTAAPGARSRALRSLALPAPRHGLDMPAHDLNPPLAVRFAPVVALWQRMLQPIAPQLKRLPVPFKDH